MKTVVYTRTAIKALGRIPRNSAIRIREKVAQFASEPESMRRNVSTLKGRPGLLRLRVGDWRVILRPSDEVLHVEDVGSRGSIYD